MRTHSPLSRVRRCPGDCERPHTPLTGQTDAPFGDRRDTASVTSPPGQAQPPRQPAVFRLLDFWVISYAERRAAVTETAG